MSKDANDVGAPAAEVHARLERLLSRAQTHREYVPQTLSPAAIGRVGSIHARLAKLLGLPAR